MGAALQAQEGEGSLCRGRPRHPRGHAPATGSHDGLRRPGCPTPHWWLLLAEAVPRASRGHHGESQNPEGHTPVPQAPQMCRMFQKGTGNRHTRLPSQHSGSRQENHEFKVIPSYTPKRGGVEGAPCGGPRPAPVPSFPGYGPPTGCVRARSVLCSEPSPGWVMCGHCPVLCSTGFRGENNKANYCDPGPGGL